MQAAEAGSLAGWLDARFKYAKDRDK